MPKPTGALAIFGNQHPTPFTGFSSAVQRVYRAVVPEWGDPSDLPPPQETEKASADKIARTGLFEQVRVAPYEWTREFTHDEYLRLLNTYSGHRSLDDERRARLFAVIGDVIDKEFGGRVTRPYLSVLYIAKKCARVLCARGHRANGDRRNGPHPNRHAFAAQTATMVR